MGKVESRRLSDEKYEKPNGYFNSKHCQTGYIGLHCVSQSISSNLQYKDGHNESAYSKEKVKTKKLITSRSPRTTEQHQAIIHAEIKDTSFYENDFRRRSLSESHAQLRKQILERRQRIIDKQGESEDIQHRVKWADTSGDSLTSELRRRSYSHGATGVPSKPILKKLTGGLSTDHDSYLDTSNSFPVDTRYL